VQRAAQAAWRTWASDKGIDAEKVDLMTFKDAAGGELRGMVAVEDIEGDEELLVVPSSAVFQTTTGGPAPSGFDQGSWSRLDWWAQLALLLLREARLAEQSAFATWISSLPRNVGSLLTWTEAELAALEYPALLERVARQREELEEVFERASACAPFVVSKEDFLWAVQVVRSRSFSGPYEGRGAGDRLLQVALIAILLTGGIASGLVSVEDGLGGAFAALVAIPLTDFFVGSSSKLKRHVLCPVVDYLNHDSATVSDIAYEYFADAFAVRVVGGFKKGEQVFINYGEKRSNDDLLQYYGFVEVDCPNDVYDMDILANLDAEAAASGEALRVKLTRTGPDDEGLAALRTLLATDRERSQLDDGSLDASVGPLTEENEALVWKAVTTACEVELQRTSAGAANQLSFTEVGPAGLAARFRAEKEKVLLACRAHAESRRGTASAAPLSLTTLSAVLPEFRPASEHRHPWADALLSQTHVDELQRSGYAVIPEAFDLELAARCLKECEELDAAARTTVTTNRCNRGSRSTWLEFGAETERSLLQSAAPALGELSQMLAGLPDRANGLGLLEGPPLAVHAATMLAVYPERAAEYAVHKDSYAPAETDPATGASRRLTVLAYFNEWKDGAGGELKIYEADKGKPDLRRFQAVSPMAGTVVVFDSRRVWHSVAPSLRGPRWALTLWVH